MYTCLIIEDDAALAEQMGQFLKKNDFQCDTAHALMEALEYLVIRSYDCVILDLVLPDAMGATLVAKIREKTSVPIIIESGNFDKGSRIAAYKSGADGYIAKPIDLDVLLAMIESNLRRSRQNAALDQLETVHLLIDRGLRKAYLKGEGGEKTEIRLSGTEYRLLLTFMENEDRLLLYRDIYRMVWETPFVDDMRPLMVHMSNLKKKVDFSGNMITTVRGAGYIFSDSG